MINAVAGDIIGDALLQVQMECGDSFSPHAIHTYFSNPVNANLTWSTQIISDGKSFKARTLKGTSHGRIQCIINCSYTTRNSHARLLQKYEDYQKLIKDRRAAGKTQEDDEEEDIRKVEIPFKIQVPFPESVKNLDVSSIKSQCTGGIEFKLIDSPVVEVKQSVSRYLARSIEPSGAKFVDLARLTSSIDILEFKTKNRDNACEVQERVIFIHDDDFESGNFLLFQVNLMSYKYRQLLLEVEVFNLRGVQVATIQQFCTLTPTDARL